MICWLTGMRNEKKIVECESEVVDWTTEKKDVVSINW